MRLRARVDKNQSKIVEELRAVGASVEYLHRLGRGVPDLLVGYCGVNYVMEVKDGDASPSRQALTPDEVKWMRNWRGQKCVVRSPVGALKAIGIPPAE